MGFGQRSALLAALALSGAARAADRQDVRQPRTTVMVAEFPRGVVVIGSPARCPGAPAEEDAEDSICLAELYEGRVRVVRHISGPRVRMGTRVRMTAHARRWPPGTRMLVATVPFNDRGTTGRFAFWWDMPEERGDFCEPAEDVARWQEGPLRRAFEAGSRRRFRAYGYRERVDMICIQGGR
jgi:hypothetical protein